MRGDFECFHEPFGRAYYAGIDRRTTRSGETALLPDVSYAQTWAEMRARSALGPVFSKDFPYYIMHMADGEFLDQFQHTFLVRDPAKVLPSMYAHWDHFTMEETGFVELRQMFELVVERYKSIPPVIDAEDLVAHPAAMTEAYCRAVSIPFIAETLEWEEGDRQEVTWFGGDWHDQLKHSTGFVRQNRHYVEIDKVPWLRDMYEACLPHYAFLYRHRIRP